MNGTLFWAWDLAETGHATALRANAPRRAFRGGALGHRSARHAFANPHTAAQRFASKQDRAITPQESDIADPHADHRLSTTPETLPAGAEKAAMPATTVSSSPSARGGVLAWLHARWSALSASRTVVAANEAHSDVPRIAQQLRGDVHGFREFTAPRRLQLGTSTTLRARAVGQRTPLRGSRV